MVGAVHARTEMKVGVFAGFPVAVEQRFFSGKRRLGRKARGTCRTAAENRILAASGLARVVGELAVAIGHRHIVLAHACAHFTIQGVLESSGGRAHGVGVSVFGFQVVSDIGREQCRVFENGLPVFIAQPRIVVMLRDVVQRFAAGFFPGYRRSHGGLARWGRYSSRSR